MEFCLILFTVVNVTLTYIFLSDKLVRLSNGTLLSLLQTYVNLNVGYKKKDEREKNLSIVSCVYKSLSSRLKV